jgi:hypothetical protein
MDQRDGRGNARGDDEPVSLIGRPAQRLGRRLRSEQWRDRL